MLEKQKRLYRNELYTNIDRLSRTVDRNTEKIKRLRDTYSEGNGFKNIEYGRQQVQKTKDSINEAEKNIIEMKEEIVLLDRGELDEKVTSMYKEQTAEVKKKNEINKSLRDEKKKDKIEDKKISRSYYEGIRSSDYKQRRKEKDYKYQYKRYCGILESLPAYMAKNLKTMPSNKGYIWRGVWWFGDVKQKNNRNSRNSRNNGNTDKIVLFEKKKGGILLINEFDSFSHTIWEKVGKGPRRLVSKVQRRIKI